MVGLVLAAVVAVPVSAAGAGTTGTAARQPDGQVRHQKTVYEQFGTEKYDEPWIGDDIYNTTASGQAAKVSYSDVTPGAVRWIFGVSVQNDGTTSDQVRVHATGRALYGWTVKYYDGSQNVTSAVVNGTFTTPTLAPGDSHLIKVKVARLGDDSDVDSLRRLISLTSVGNPNKVDAVKVAVKRFTCSC
jgi:hypothetical protein